MAKREKSKVELYQDPQLKGYVYAVHKLYNIPLNTITAAHYYPITNNLVNVQYTVNQIHAHIRSVVDDVWKIRKAKKMIYIPSGITSVIGVLINLCAQSLKSIA